MIMMIFKKNLKRKKLLTIIIIYWVKFFVDFPTKTTDFPRSLNDKQGHMADDNKPRDGIPRHNLRKM